MVGNDRISFYEIIDSKGNRSNCGKQVRDTVWKCSLEKNHKGKCVGYSGHILFQNGKENTHQMR